MGIHRTQLSLPPCMQWCSVASHSSSHRFPLYCLPASFCLFPCGSLVFSSSLICPSVVFFGLTASLPGLFFGLLICSGDRFNHFAVTLPSCAFQQHAYKGLRFRFLLVANGSQQLWIQAHIASHFIAFRLHFVFFLAVLWFYSNSLICPSVAFLGFYGLLAWLFLRFLNSLYLHFREFAGVECDSGVLPKGGASLSMAGEISDMLSHLSKSNKRRIWLLLYETHTLNFKNPTRLGLFRNDFFPNTKTDFSRRFT